MFYPRNSCLVTFFFILLSLLIGGASAIGHYFIKNKAEERVSIPVSKTTSNIVVSAVANKATPVTKSSDYLGTLFTEYSSVSKLIV